MADVPAPVKRNVPASDTWQSLRSEMDRLFDRFTAGFGGGVFAPPRLMDFNATTLPAVDITENDTAFKLSAELPGLSEKDVDISVSGDTLTITGEKRQEKEDKQRNYYLTERSYGQFRRSSLLPEVVDRTKIDATFANGVLTITLPKTAKAEGRKIEVKPAA